MSANILSGSTKSSSITLSIGGADKQLNVMEEDFTLPDDMFTDNPVFVDTSQEFDDDCGDACKIWRSYYL